MNHLNAVIDDFDRTVGHFTDLWGAQLLSDMPRDEWHACLMAIGGIIFEFFAPRDDLLHARFGPHYIGVEYRVDDVEGARDAVQTRGMRIVRELGAAFHVHPLDAYGVAFEFYDGDFHAVPCPVPYLEPIHPPAVWRDHPLGITGLDRYRVTVADLESAVRFLTEFVDGRVVYEETRPAGQSRVTGIELGATTVELASPIGPGPVERFLARNGEGISSVVFGTVDLDQSSSWLGSRGIRLEPGDREGTLAIHPADNCGLRFELAPSAA